MWERSASICTIRGLELLGQLLSAKHRYLSTRHGFTYQKTLVLDNEEEFCSGELSNYENVKIPVPLELILLCFCGIDIADVFVQFYAV